MKPTPDHAAPGVGRNSEERASARHAASQDLLVEEDLLGAMLLSNDAISAALERCSPKDFVEPTHGNLFAAIARLFELGEPVDVVTVTDELRRTLASHLCSDPVDLIVMQGSTPSAAHADHYAEIVAEQARIRASVISPGDDGPVDDSSSYPRDFPGIET